jgi:hypothetical protein
MRKHCGMIAVALAVWMVACGAEVPQKRSQPGTSTEIPFELRGGVVLVPARVGSSRILRLVLDTGMFDGVLLWEPVADLTFPGPLIEVKIPGAGTGEPARGWMTDSGAFTVGPVEFKAQRVVWLSDSLMSGFPSDGVIGNSLFGHGVVELDYDRKVIRLHKPGFKPDSSWAALPMTVHKANTPWVQVSASVSGETPRMLDSYIDLADNAEFIFLVREDSQVRVPEGVEPAYLGRGLSGDVYGSKGRAALVQIDTYKLRDLTVSFAPDAARSKQPGAEAVIGGSLLARFNTIYDYAGGWLYIKRRAS